MDLYRKKTSKNQYLLPTSCHPTHTFGNIPYSLALRIRRICSSEKDLDVRMAESREMLLHRKYNRNIVDAGIKRAKEMDRQMALKRVEKKSNDRIVMAVKYHPALPSFSTILKKHWTTMVKEKRLLRIFPKPPMVAYQQHQNSKSMLVRAKISTESRQRKHNGMKKCNKQCKVCSFIDVRKDFTSNTTGEKFSLKGNFNCNPTGVIYVTSCAKCGIQYVGQTKRKFCDRIREHWYSITNNKDTANAIHFNSRGHSVDDFRAMVLEKVMPNSNSFLLEREDKWIKTLETKDPHGLNLNN